MSYRKQMDNERKITHNFRQMKLASGEEIVGDVYQWNDETHDEIVIKNAMRLNLYEGPTGDKFFSFRPWMVYQENEEDLKNAPAMSFDGGPEFADPSWSHLQVCYAILRDIVLTSKIPLAVKKKVIRVWFVKKLIEVFRSKDKRERTQVKLSVHRIYGSLTNRRSCIRRKWSEERDNRSKRDKHRWSSIRAMQEPGIGDYS